MWNKKMNYEDFIRKPEPQPQVAEVEAKVEGQEPIETDAEPEMTTEVELDVHKEVVAELAADKAAQDVKITELETDNQSLKKKIAELEKEMAKLKSANDEMAAALAKVGETLARNSELPGSNQVSVLDRNPEVDDRFEGETREHVLEALKAARETAEAEGRLRCAQVLEAVLAANESSGTLANKRAALEKIFADNMNIINGQVINELDKLGIRYKDGETYLLAKEIAKRSY